MDVRGLNVVVTGKIAGESRQTAEAKLTQAGATVQRAVTPTTQLLVMGAGTSTKSKALKADQLGIRKAEWDEVMNGGPASVVEDEVRPVGGIRPRPHVIAPMKCKTADSIPSGPEWLHEIKWDGERCIATVQDGMVWMQSSTGKSDYALQFPAVRNELRLLENCILDGELVVLDEDMTMDAAEVRRVGAAGSFIVFDVLETDGKNLRDLPLSKRRDVAVAVLGRVPVLERITLSPEFTDGELLVAWVAGKGLEGIVSKRRNSQYVDGTRGASWLKTKVRREQEFLVLGWTPGKDSNAGHPGAWVLGFWNEQGALIYAGKVGTGRHVEDWDALRDRATVRMMPPTELWLNSLDLNAPEKASVTWCEPDQVVQVAFQRWTPDGRLWHPSWLRDRPDKDPTDVRRET